MESKKESPSYYGVLGVSMDSSDDEIRRAYRKLAMQWHPDKWTKNPSLLGNAKRKFQQIQEAYSVLSDQKKRSMYNAGLYDPEDEVDEGFADFLQEMSSLMESVKKEEKSYSFGEIQSMFWELERSFKDSDCFGFDYTVEYEDSRSSKRVRADGNPLPQLHQSGMGRCV